MQVSKLDKTMMYIKPFTYSMIMARDARGGIGLRDGMPWPKCKEDFKWFKENTWGKVVVMGFKTWETLGSKPLKGRLNIVMTTKPEFTLDKNYRIDEKVDGQKVVYCRSVVGLSEFLSTFAGSEFNCGETVGEFETIKHTVRVHGEIMIMGGASLYQQFQHHYDRLYLTTFAGQWDADTFLKINLTPDSWELRFRNSLSRMLPVFEIYTRAPLMEADHGFVEGDHYGV